MLHLFEQLSANVEAAAPAPAPDVVASPGSNTGSADNMRVCALHQRSPIHMFMFDNKGALLIANKAAMEALQPGELCKPACILVSAPYEMMSCLSFALQQSAQDNYNCCLRNRSNNPSAVTCCSVEALAAYDTDLLAYVFYCTLMSAISCLPGALSLSCLCIRPSPQSAPLLWHCRGSPGERLCH